MDKVANFATTTYLNLWLKGIGKTKPYGRKAEQELFRLSRQGNRNARAKLIFANMRFVLKVALQYKECVIPISDLVNDGAIGLAKAVDLFDYTRGIRFISYAVWWIRAYIKKAVCDHSSLIRIPINQYTSKNQLINNLKNSEMRNFACISSRCLSIDAPSNNDSRKTFSDILPDKNTELPDRIAETSSVAKMTKNLLAKLPEREAMILKKLFGIDSDGPKTLKEIARTFNISHERVRQLRNQAFTRMRDPGFHESVVNWLPV